MVGRRLEDFFFRSFATLIAMFSASLLIFIVLFIAKESLPCWNSTSPIAFISGSDWFPVGDEPVLGIAPMIAGTVTVSVLSVFIALPFAVGTALWLSCFAGRWARRVMIPSVDLLAGIPSVVFGFFGLLVVVPTLESVFGLPSGESVMAGAIILAMMVLPYITSACVEHMDELKKRYDAASKALGVDSRFMAYRLVLSGALRSVWIGSLLALARAMGETMAVMMVMGNSPLWPRLLGRAETIPALIALEMGGASAGSPHSAALYGAGLVLMIMMLAMILISKGSLRGRRWKQ
ncbi:phosphate ABC transporter permease subunit PstC [Dethiosulfovibrio sp. F2B]|uniref:phosphate ABC transporter permease subunit PstC n=1 Tax=Dethiosulfovibrio faecalis TaxID=2720018 RepID=UPI001F3E1C67|nr:phosphate ABC transporter permease subunit PstC [Dethiosulfovibrio faecalis]MCF4151213.1 phosphate ABC transporter permease subunit PstC [Dethiosulfovibrio faecalis]